MKTFKVKDLMISIDSPTANAGAGGLCAWATQNNCIELTLDAFTCFEATLCQVSFCEPPTRPLPPCRVTIIDCRFTKLTTLTPVQTAIYQLDEKELADMKITLKSLITKVDTELQSDKEDLAYLEDKLTKALAEIKQQKGNAAKGK
jgi:hypothetical protein